MNNKNNIQAIINNFSINAGGGADINAFYSLYAGNVNNYLSNISVAHRNGTLFNGLFSNTLNKSQIQSLINDANSKSNLYLSPAGAFAMNNLSDLDFVTVLNTGKIIPSGTASVNYNNYYNNVIASVNQIWNLKINNWNQAAQQLANNRFSCSFSYQGEHFQNINFSQKIDSTTTGNLFGLLLIIGAGNTTVKESDLVLQLIKLYSCNNDGLTNNSYNASIQTATIGYFASFTENITSAVGIWTPQKPVQSIRSGSIPPSGVNATNDGGNIIIANDDEISPSGITLNQFTQPSFNQVLSILDILRKEDNFPIQENVSIIHQAAPIVPTQPQNKKDCTTILLENLKLEDKLKIIESLKSEYQNLKKQLENLNLQQNKISNSSGFTLTSIQAGIGKAADAVEQKTVEASKEAWKQLTDSANNVVSEGKTIVSSTKNILSSSWNDIKNVSSNLYDSLKITKPSINPISPITLSNLRDKLGKNCDDFNNIVKITNKGNTQQVTRQAGAISQKTQQVVADLGNKQTQVQSQLNNIEELLKKLQP